ncbi:MAG: hypothetical protein WA116_00385 [Anaerolineaceae bacterium]
MEFCVFRTTEYYSGVINRVCEEMMIQGFGRNNASLFRLLQAIGWVEREQRST